MTMTRSGGIAGSRATESIEPGGVAVAEPSGAAALVSTGQAIVSDPKPGHRWPRSAKRFLLVALLVVTGGFTGLLLLPPVAVTVSQGVHRDRP